MDTYENNIPQYENETYLAENLALQDEVPFQEPQEEYIAQEFQLAPKRKKVSPFEDSPYIACAPMQPTKKSAKRKKHNVWKPILAILLAACLVVGTCAITTEVVNAQWESRVADMSQQFDAKLASLEKKMGTVNEVVLVPSNTGENGEGLYTPSQVYAANVGSVVMIVNKVTNKQGGVSTSGGSGFIVSKNGYIVTNQHVVDGNGAITVITTDGAEYTATLVGEDSVNDVALLKVEAENLRPVTLGSSAELMVGDQVAAIGNPLGELTSTITVGYISAKERNITTEGTAINMLQTDAAINSGNSGGPLFNMRVEVIGITTAKYSGNSASGASIEGIGFAIPIDDVMGILSDLGTYGYVSSGYLGVMISDMDAQAANYYGLPVGAYVSEVIMGYAAQKAGIRAKDIIVDVGGYEVRNVSGLTRALRQFKPGDEVTVVVYRSGRELTLTVVLDARPAE